MFNKKESAEVANLRKKIEDDTRLLSDQNREIVRLKEELKHAKRLLGLYEACIMTGTKIDFPDVTGGKKGGNNEAGNDIDFSDF